MPNKILSGKRLQIDKANASMVVILAVSAFIAVFSLVASKGLLSQRSYQSRVITEKKKALTQLKANNEAATQLVSAYKTFLSAPDNIIGGIPTGTGDRDGDNAKIVLDALPSKYDFPALITSIEKVLTARNYAIDSIVGVDDELNQVQTADTKVQPVAMPFDVKILGNLDTAQGVLDVLQLSIRPMELVKIELSGDDAKLTISVNANSYYQPQKSIKITKKVVN